MTTYLRNVATYKWKVRNRKIEIISFVVISFLTDPHCRFRCVGQGMKQTYLYLWYRPMGTNCATLLADLFLYSYEADIIQGLLQKHEKKLGRSFNFKTRPPNIANMLSIKNSSMLKISVSENFLVESEWCFTN
jgi:hypothetical protein